MAATILIAEVNTAVRTAFSLLFQRAGYDVLTASDGGGALDTATRLSPDLVIVNLMGEHGPDTGRALHADARTAGTPVIL